MSGKVLLRHVPLNSGTFKDENCEDVFAFREFGIEDNPMLKHKFGLICDRALYDEYAKLNIRTFVYQVIPMRAISYIFSTKYDMRCQDDDIPTYYDTSINYVANYGSITSDDVYDHSLHVVDELTAIQQQFTYESAHHSCIERGMFRAVRKQRILLQHFRQEHYNFTFFNSTEFRCSELSPCQDVFSFREYHTDVLGIEASKHGVYCDKAKYLELLHGNTHFHAFTYYSNTVTSPWSEEPFHLYKTIEYVFASLKDIECTMPTVLPDGYSDPNNRYTSNDGTTNDLQDEKTVLTRQFGMFEAIYLYKHNGRLPFQNYVPVSTAHTVLSRVNESVRADLIRTTTLECCINNFNSNYTVPIALVGEAKITVPISEMEVLSSVASVLLASPFILTPAMLLLANFNDWIFDGLANFLTNLF